MERDVASGGKSGVPRKRTMLVNGVRRDGTYDVDTLRASIKAQLGHDTAKCR